MTLRFLATIALITACLVVAGCSAPGATRSEGRVDWIQLAGFWQPHLLYLLDSPHPRLYVEVDVVEGCAPDDATLNKLRDFLAAHCRKPEGIEIARSDLIPIKDARDYHCLDRNCLMNAAISMSVVRRLLGLKPVKQDQLCQGCEAELAGNRVQPPAANVRFVGPVMARSEEGYQVLSLPDHVGLSVGNQVEEACRNFASFVRKAPQYLENDNKLFAPPGGTAKVSGPLTAHDVAEIKRYVFRERAALVSGDYAAL